MLTSSIQHPKRSVFYSVHEWQLIACKGAVDTAFLLSYIEDKSNLENSETTEINLAEIEQLLFFKPHLVHQYLAYLVNINFIQVIHPASPGAQETTFKVRFNIDTVNSWISVFEKNRNQKQSLSEKPEDSFLFNEIKIPLKGSKASKNLFSFWKYKTSHNRSNPQDKFLKMADQRIKEGYSELDIAIGIIGLSLSDWHRGKYDHFVYVVRDGKQLDMMIQIAIKKGINDQRAQKQYLDFLSGKDSIIEQTKSISNSYTGNEML